MTHRSLPALLRSLTEPSAAIPQSERRRARLLAWLHLALLALSGVSLVVVFVINPAGDPLREVYGLLIAGMVVILVAAFGLNRAGRYTASAWLTVAVGFLGPWASVLLDSSILSGDIVALVYTVLPVFLCSLLLSAPATAALAAVQVAGLLLIPALHPGTIVSSWPSLVTFFVFMSVLSVVSASISRRDLAQIDRQARQLAESEARLREQSVRDALTALFNRRYLDETLQREVLRAARAHTSLGVVMMDIDHFKRFNDTYGHAVGDDLLRDLGALLRASVRGSDIACRYGGEEFILLLPEATRVVAGQRAERIRQAARTVIVRYEGKNVEPITLSIGVAAFPEDGATGEALLKRADDALYRAKREGRDRTALPPD